VGLLHRMTGARTAMAADKQSSWAVHLECPLREEMGGDGRQLTPGESVW
jgi:hypothetical protein